MKLYPTDRRTLLKAGPLAAAGLILPGCATSMARQRPSCLPAVKVSEDRIIRTAAGLRPYRDSGFVVRSDRIGETRIVHNYGHGGAGITLSWGSSRLAVDLGLPGHQGAVAVLGCGVMGLTTARLVQEAGFAVTVYAKALPPDTTSNVAGGQFHPYGHYRRASVTPEWKLQFAAAVDYSWRRFQIMVGDDYGIRWLPTYADRDRPEERLLPTFPPVNRMLERHENPFPVDRVALYETMYVETGRFLRQLMRDVQIAGGRILVRSFASPEDIAALPEKLVFNCTGLGSRELFGDGELLPVRGQVAILIPQPEIRYAFTGEAGYMFPRPDGILLGGTFERDVWSAEPEPETIARIIASHRDLFDGFRCAHPA